MTTLPEAVSKTPPFGTLDLIQSWERECVWDAYDRGLRSVAGEAATGTGKTYLAGLLIQDSRAILGDRPALFLVHQKELMRQAVAEFEDQGLNVLVESAHRKAHRKLREDRLFKPDVIVATHLSLHPKRILNFRRDTFSLGITDECHVSEAESFKHIYDYFDFPLHVGLTATLFRTDGSPVYGDEATYKERVFRYRINDAVKRGHLSPIEEVRLPVNLDLSKIRMKGRGVKDVDPQELRARVLPKVETLVNSVRQEVEKYGLKHILVFAPDIESANTIAAALRSIGLDFQAVWGDDEDRDAKIAAFKAGKLLGLVNCELLTTGFNYRPIDAIFMFVATTSLVKFIQCVGRGTRLSPETGKDVCRVFGPEWRGVGGLRSSVDLFLEDPDDVRVRERAAEIQGKTGKPPQEAAEQAEEELERERQHEEYLELERLDLAAKRNAVRKRDVAYVTSHRLPYGEAQGGPVEAATPDQVRELRKAGYGDLGRLTRAQAGELVVREAERKAKGLATLKQVESLLKCRVQIRGRPITRAEAEALPQKQATRLLLERWGKIPKRSAS